MIPQQHRCVKREHGHEDEKDGIKKENCQL